MGKRMLLIVNPFSGKRQARNVLFEILDTLCKEGWDPAVHITQSRGDATLAAKAAEGLYDKVVCIGGDGTLNEMVSGLAQWKAAPSAGYIPSGTTNDFAATLGFPKAPKEAALTAVNGEPFTCDIGRFDDRFFVYIAAFGAFTDVAYSTDQQAKNIFGRLAYLFQGALELPSLQQGYHMKVECEDGVIEDDFIFGAVSNSLSIGGFKGLPAEEIFLDDGELEVLLVRMPKNAAELSELVTALLGQQFGQHGVYFFKVRSVRFTCDRPVSWTLDGEDGDSRETVSIACVPGAVTFAVGKRPERKVETVAMLESPPAETADSVD